MNVPLEVSSFSFIKLMIDTLLKLPAERDGFSFFGNVIKRVEISGIVVGIRNKPSINTFIVDDGTGLVECVSFNNDTPSSFPEIQRDSFIRVWGLIREWRGKRNLMVVHYELINDPDYEALSILEIVHATNSVYAPGLFSNQSDR
eukprot:TRINITY_DN4814_c0_g1_i2.p1 TRINITY_DN4814_c0_g1~~TRINITY_DN4814_c0_g1_i2.p1  ORF type:complete len:145 (-),score=22.33 TRINITY_DN4814_c0_g1_i2:135-569(-)